MKEITTAVLLAARDERQRNNTTYKELAARLLGDVTRDKELRDRLDKYERKKNFIVEPWDKDLAPAKPKFEKPLTVPLANTLLISDTHAVNTDIRFLEKVLEFAKKRGVTQCIHAGDVFNADALSNQTRPWEIVTPVQDDLSYGYAMLDMIAQDFLLWIITGNHDEWVMRHYGIDAKTLFVRWNATQYPYLYLGKSVMVGHLETVHQEAGYLAAQIAKKNKKIVFVGHDHLTGLYAEDSHIGVSIGGMLLKENIYYKQMAFNAMSEWTNGFVILIDEKAELYRQKGRGFTKYGEIRDVC